jgi:hypothetical protein
VSPAAKTPQSRAPLGKFQDPDWTATGGQRAIVPFDRLETLWINTGTLCNITCQSCYIESSPKNDRLVYITAPEAAAYFDEIEREQLGTREIGFTGGEPFLNPHLLPMLEDALRRGFHVLVLTNAMQPMQRPMVKEGLLRVARAFSARLKLRVSLDHYSKMLHERERGPLTWEKAVQGLDWLSANGFNIALAGRTCWKEDEAALRAGYAELIKAHGWVIDPRDPSQLTLLPEMDALHDVPEITTACWGILKKTPSDVMCATSRMVVKRKGAAKPVIVPCTLLPYEAAFEMGATLTQAAKANEGMFVGGAVKLCHAHCAKFCVLGGGRCA